ncbi:MAG: elongation factor G, partial [Planctomycetes bacterium]|nr:elongation factor G [Planctomycetota bacterium]
AYYFEGDNGEEVVVKEIPADMLEEAKMAREEMLDEVSLFSEELTDALLEESEISVEMIQTAVRIGTISRQMTPVFLGSAYKNKAVQPLLNAVISYLPSPLDIENEAIDLDKDEETVVLESDFDKPTVALAFKLEDGQYGQLTYIRVYQGALRKGDTMVNSRTGRKARVGRLARLHADELEEIDDTMAGDIVALFGIDCASGDTFTDGTVE